MIEAAMYREVEDRSGLDDLVQSGVDAVYAGEPVTQAARRLWTGQYADELAPLGLASLINARLAALRQRAPDDATEIANDTTTPVRGLAASIKRTTSRVNWMSALDGVYTVADGTPLRVRNMGLTDAEFLATAYAAREAGDRRKREAFEFIVALLSKPEYAGLHVGMMRVADQVAVEEMLK